jgi:membrane-anchored protein YejM (alkaline phosphatase superfamily)
MGEPVTRRLLFRWLGWFAMANAVVLAVIALRHISGFEFGSDPLAWVYLLTVYVSHNAVLALLPLMVLFLLVVIVPARRTVQTLAVLLMAVTIALVLLDSLLWSQSRFHINMLTVKILGMQSWIFVATMLLIGLVFESLLSGRIWNWVQKPGRRYGKWIGWLCGLCFLVAQGIYAWSDASYYVPVTRLAPHLPVHRGITAKKFLSRHGIVDIRQSRERRLAERLASDSGHLADSGLDYPRNPLSCVNQQPLNLLIILVDAMRSDMIRPDTTPGLTIFAASRASRFQHHYSGGNSSRMGVFSFFYGLPPGYFPAFEAAQRSPVLVDQLQQQSYQLGLFSSATMVRPVTMDRTTFSNVPNLRVLTEPESDPSWKRDRTMTHDWFDWLDGHDAQAPFFGFLFYNSPNARSAPENYKPQFAAPAEGPMADMVQAYKTAVHYTDSLIGEVLDDLARRGLDRNTVVLVSADHGEEFNESGEGFDDHGSSYSDYQIQVPLLLAWPGREPRVYDHRSSHYDVAPTLMKGLLGCSNPVTDYSSGRDLFSGESWPWMISGSYYNYAIIEPEQVTVTFPNGLFEVRDGNYRLLDQPQFNADVLEAVMRENTRFYHK